MQIVADLHLHSKYSRAVSKNMTLPIMAKMAQIKGIDLLSTGDFTHPDWFATLQEELVEENQGIYYVKNQKEKGFARYVIGGEISCIYTQNGKGRRVHLIVLLPSLEIAQKVNTKLKEAGCNLRSDGRPITGLPVTRICEILFSVSLDIIVIPAHIWTPWFGVFGSKSGFDSLRESFGKYAEKIYAIETGLSSNPEMNWRIKELDSRAIVSFSDAHSPDKLGRELTVFSSDKKESFAYLDLKSALQSRGDWKIAKTIEFYPEEGKYHIDGHRACGVTQDPLKTKTVGNICLVCGKVLTLGVLGRVQQLADREINLKKKTDKFGVEVYSEKDLNRPPYQMLVTLKGIIAEVLVKGVGTQSVTNLYDKCIGELGSELDILTKLDLKLIEKTGGEKLAQAVKKVRVGDIFISPGFDGVFGVVSIWPKEGKTVISKTTNQMTLFK